MFRKSNKEPQLDAFASVPMMLESSALKQYSDQGHWHNQFHDQVVMRIDETIFSTLFNNTTGAPNSSVRTGSSRARRARLVGRRRAAFRSSGLAGFPERIPGPDPTVM